MTSVQHPNVVHYNLQKNIIQFFPSIPQEDTEKFYITIKLIIQFNNV